MGRNRAFSITELIVAVGIFAILMVVGSMALMSTGRIWRATAGRDTAIREVEKARQALERDLELTSAREPFLWRTEVPASLSAGGYDGDAINFLSAVDPAVGQATYGNDGSVFWMRNVTYYLVVPSGHTECAGHRDGQSYDDACPHKVLLRQVTDHPPASNPVDPLTMETLLPVGTSFPRPATLPMTPTLRTVAINLLTFRTSLGVGGVNLDVRAVAIADAQRSLSIGATPLGTGKFTLQEVFNVYPKN